MKPRKTQRNFPYRAGHAVSFNEAAAVKPRKTYASCACWLICACGFNEAAAVKPRKTFQPKRAFSSWNCGCFNEAAAVKPRKTPSISDRPPVEERFASMRPRR